MMAAETYSWLHLTDFHFGLKGQKFLWPNLRQPFLDDLAKLYRRCGPWQAVFYTGDFVQKGTSDEFSEMQKEVLDRLWKKLGELGSGRVVLLAVPGNHDLFRPDPKCDNAAIDRMLDEDGFIRIADKFWDNPSGSYRRVVNDAFAAYAAWWKDAPQRPKANMSDGILPGDFSCTLESDGRRIGVIGLNTAFLQLKGRDYRECLVWDVRQLQAVCDGAVDDWLGRHHVCLLLTHHGPEWLLPVSRFHGESEIAPAGRFAAHLFGHMHETKIEYIRKGGSGDARRFLQSCSAFGMEMFGEPPMTTIRCHGYAAGQIKFSKKSGSLRLWPRTATDKPDGWRFIPDNNHCVLRSDEGTEPEKIRICDIKTRASLAKSVRKTTKTHKTTLLGDHLLPFVPHSTLPSRRPFFGREKELTIIAKVLNPEHVGWGVVLDGPGGIGKTSLAVEAAHLAPVEIYPLKLFITAKGRRLDPDGIHKSQDFRVDDYNAVLTEVGLALGRDDIPKEGPERRADLIRHALASHRALLVLDNLESFTPAERRRLYDLFEALPRTCRAIVTTRRRDDTAAKTLRLDKLDADAANQLLDSLGEDWPRIAKLTAGERHRLYAEANGNPLLLTWTAGQLGRAKGRCRTVKEAVARLQEVHRLQQVNEQNDPLEFIFGDLLDTFTEDETAVLAALAHFSLPADLSWLLPIAGLSETATQTALDDLCNRALLIEDDAAGTWLLPPLAARFMRLRRSEAVGAAGQRLTEKAYAIAVQYGYGRNAPFRELETAWPVIQSALPLLMADDNARLQSVCAALEKFLEFTGRWDELLSLNQVAEVKALDSGDYLKAGWRAFHEGGIHQRRGEVEAVIDCAGRCSSHWKKAGAGAREQAVAIRLRGRGYRLRKDYATAIAAFQEALDISRSLSPESKDVAIGLNSLADAKSESGDLNGAETDFRESLRIANKVGYREGIASSTGNLSELYLDRKDWLEAERWAREALRLSKNVGRQELIASDHHRLAVAILRQGRPCDALPHAQQAVAIFAHLRSRDLSDAQATLVACEAACSSAQGQ